MTVPEELPRWQKDWEEIPEWKNEPEEWAKLINTRIRVQWTDEWTEAYYMGRVVDTYVDDYPEDGQVNVVLLDTGHGLIFPVDYESRLWKAKQP